ncbi:hypothetical protein [Microseira wollei]|nr:hypothetical protein [Microseira wollei]
MGQLMLPIPQEKPTSYGAMRQGARFVTCLRACTFPPNRPEINHAVGE